ncbi:MAG: DUF1559 domain-containing protein [Phycisphaerae bacterium]|nr:DUF1559 domain-containing protein [Phycisphaerae bacterium]
MKKQGFTLTDMVITIVVLIVLLYIFMPLNHPNRDRARRTFCMNNQKQIAMAAYVYADEHDGNFPLSMAYQPDRNFYEYLNIINDKNNKSENHPDLLMDYLQDFDIYQCPFGGYEDEQKAQDLYGQIPPEQSLYCSYNFYWNFKPENLDFVGADRTDCKRACDRPLSSDFIGWDDGRQGWWITHYKKNQDAPAIFDGESVRMGLLEADNKEEKPEDIKMAASYADGHVEQFDIEDANYLSDKYVLPAKLGL